MTLQRFLNLILHRTKEWRVKVELMLQILSMLKEDISWEVERTLNSEKIDQAAEILTIGLK